MSRLNLKILLDEHPEYHRTYLGILKSRKEIYEMNMGYINDPSFGLTEYQKEILTTIIDCYEERIILSELGNIIKEETILIAENIIHLVSDGKNDVRETVH